MNTDTVEIQVNANVDKVIKDPDVINVLRNQDVEMELVIHQDHTVVNACLALLVNCVTNQFDHPEPHVAFPTNASMVDNVSLHYLTADQCGNTHVIVPMVS